MMMGSKHKCKDFRCPYAIKLVERAPAAVNTGIITYTHISPVIFALGLCTAGYTNPPPSPMSSSLLISVRFHVYTITIVFCHFCRCISHLFLKLYYFLKPFSSHSQLSHHTIRKHTPIPTHTHTHTACLILVPLFIPKTLSHTQKKLTISHTHIPQYKRPIHSTIL